MASLGIECGATKSKVIVQVAQWISEEGKKQEIFLDFGPANYSLMNDEELTKFLQNIHDKVKLELKNGFGKDQVPLIEKIALGMAGIVSESQRNAVGTVVKLVFGSNLTKIWIGNDIQVAFNYLTSNFTTVQYGCQLLVISGTGSASFGRRGKIEQKIGGSGHILGDSCSGYAIAHKALRAAYRQFEHFGTSVLLSAMMKNLNKEKISDLIDWSLHANKSSLASLAPIVLSYWTEHQDEVATTIILEAIKDLSMDCQALLQNLYELDPIKTSQDKNVLMGFTGSILTKCSEFSSTLTSAIKMRVSCNEKIKHLNIHIVTVDTETVRGTLNFLLDSEPLKPHIEKLTVVTSEQKDEDQEFRLRQLVLPTLTALPRTEERNSNSTNLDQMSTEEAIQLMLKEEMGSYKEIEKEISNISIVIQKITQAFKNGGRLFYVGAGTSGRVGILDASECPPTFKAPPHWVQGIMAGGLSALFKSIEGAEDSAVGGMEAIQMRGINEKDVVIGIAASGRTPFVWGALYGAKKAKAYTVFLTFNPNLISNLAQLDMLITVNVGPEILTGSTRLKCGTATKSILNMFTTLSMVKYGKCLENLMVDLNASNDKLRDRAARIVITILGQELPTLTKEEATIILQNNDYDIKKSVQILRTRLSS